MKKNQVPVDNAKHKELSEPLDNFYNRLSTQDRNDFLKIEAQWGDYERDFVIKFGALLRQVRDLVKRPGVRDGITFEKWVNAHNLSRSAAYRAINVANGYFRIEAKNAPDEELMLENFMSLPQKVQEKIGTGNLEPEKEEILLHTSEEVRESPIWQKMLNDISKNRKTQQDQDEKIKSLQAENQRLSNQLANSEGQRADLATQLDDANSQRHHLELQLEEEQKNQPEAVIVPPDDYDELADEVQQSRSKLAAKEKQIEELKLAISNAPNEDDVAEYERLINKLQKQNEALAKQINSINEQMVSKKDQHETHRKSYQKVVSITSQWKQAIKHQLDVQELSSDVQLLSHEELSQAGLLDVADLLENKSKQLRAEVGKKVKAGSGNVVKGNFNDDLRKRG